MKRLVKENIGVEQKDHKEIFFTALAFKIKRESRTGAQMGAFMKAMSMREFFHAPALVRNLRPGQSLLVTETAPRKPLRAVGISATLDTGW
jgi:hypothetical protein